MKHPFDFKLKEQMEKRRKRNLPDILTKKITVLLPQRKNCKKRAERFLEKRARVNVTEVKERLEKNERQQKEKKKISSHLVSYCC